MVLPQLGIKLPSDHRPPLVVDCPICYRAETLSLLPDPTNPGEWASCRGCGFAGELLALAAATWKLDARTSAKRLRQLGVIHPETDDSELARYVNQHVDIRHDAIRLWRTAKSGDHDFSDISFPGLSRLKLLRSDLDYDLFGICTYEDVLHHLPDQLQLAIETKVIDESAQLILVPLYDMPSRISGFHCSDTATGRSFYLAAGTPAPGIKAPTGLTNLSKLPMIELSSANKLVVLTNPLLAVWTQLRKLRKRSEFLPLTGTVIDKRRDHLWHPNSIANDSVVLWAFDMTVSVLNAVAKSGVKLYVTTGVDPSSKLASHKTVSWVKHVQVHGQPWQREFGKWAAKQSSDAVSQLVSEIGWTKTDIHNLSRKLPPASARALLASTPEDVPVSRVAVGKSSFVIETYDGWFLSDTSEQILNAKLVIDEICHLLPSKDQWYRGRILIEDAEVPFFEASEVVEKQTPKWMQQVVSSSARAGYPIICMPKWKNRLVYLAMQLRKPKVVSEVHTLGWNGETNELVFPRFAITGVGTVRHKQAVVHDLDLNFDPPDYCLPDIEYLSTITDQSPLVPAGLAAIASAALVQRKNEESQGVVVNPVVGNFIVADNAFGCRRFELTKFNKSKMGSVLAKADSRNWPAVIDTTALPAKTALDIVASGKLKNHIVVADPLVLLGATNLPEHDIIYVSEADHVELPIDDRLRNAIPHVLAHAMTHNWMYRQSATTGINNWYFDLRGRAASQHWQSLKQTQIELEALHHLHQQRHLILIRKEFEVDDNWELAECRDRKLLYVKPERVELVLEKILQQKVILPQMKKLIANGVTTVPLEKWTSQTRAFRLCR